MRRAGERGRQLGERACRRVGVQAHGVLARGALARGARARGRAAAGAAGAQPGRAGWQGLCTRCTQPVFDPV